MISVKNRVVLLCFSLALQLGCATEAQLDTLRIAMGPRLAASSLPPGTIFAFGGMDLPPGGWHWCNGDSLDATDPRFKPLFGTIGFSNGGDGSRYFRVPDLRGRFLRGLDIAGHNDPDVAAREPAGRYYTPPDPDLSHSGISVGSVEPDAMGRHHHPIPPHHHNIGMSGPPSGGTATGVDCTLGRCPVAQQTVDGLPLGPSSSVSALPNGGLETRPENVSVNFIIKL